MPTTRACALLLGALLAGACGKSSPPTPSPGPGPGPGDGESITGRERLGWTQAAGSSGELASFRYAIYVDGTRGELTGAACDTTAGPAGYSCSAPLPPLTPGAHTLELAAFTPNPVLESPRSAPLRVFVTGLAPPDVAGQWASGPAGETTDGAPLFVERLLDGFLLPADAAFSPDGRLFIAERPGRISIVRDGVVATALVADDVPPGGGLLALALAPDFARMRMVYVLSAGLARGGGLAYRLTRYRELAGIMAQRAVLLETPAPASPSGALRFGPDGLLYMALGSDGSQQPAGSDMGRIIRLASDGTPLSNRRSPVPLVASGLAHVGGLAWRDAGAWLWAGDGVPGREGRLVGIAAAREEPALWGFPSGESPGALLAYAGSLIPEWRGNLLVGSIEGRQILRVRLAEDDPSSVISTEPLLHERVGPIHALVAGPDGAVYFLTDRALGRIVAGERRP